MPVSTVFPGGPVVPLLPRTPCNPVDPFKYNKIKITNVIMSLYCHYFLEVPVFHHDLVLLYHHGSLLVPYLQYLQDHLLLQVHPMQLPALNYHYKLKLHTGLPREPLIPCGPLPPNGPNGPYVKGITNSINNN